MGIKTTYLVTRELAIEAIKEKINNATDEQLGDILETVVDNKFYNFIIVDQEYIEIEKKNKYFVTVFESVGSLPESDSYYE